MSFADKVGINEKIGYIGCESVRHIPEWDMIPVYGAINLKDETNDQEFINEASKLSGKTPDEMRQLFKGISDITVGGMKTMVYKCPLCGCLSDAEYSYCPNCNERINPD